MARVTPLRHGQLLDRGPGLLGCKSWGVGEREFALTNELEELRLLATAKVSRWCLSDVLCSGKTGLSAIRRIINVGCLAPEEYGGASQPATCAAAALLLQPHSGAWSYGSRLIGSQKLPGAAEAQAEAFRRLCAQRRHNNSPNLACRLIPAGSNTRDQSVFRQHGKHFTTYQHTQQRSACCCARTAAATA